MDKIASFCIDHDKLVPGIYLSRIDGDVKTYDIRMRHPNTPPYLENAALHTLEHLFATFARNSEWKDHVIYFGPMGCRTGCYFLLKDMEEADAVRLIRSIFRQIAEYEGEIPGATAKECGNYLEHDLAGARKEAQDFLPIIEDWDGRNLVYPA